MSRGARRRRWSPWAATSLGRRGRATSAGGLLCLLLAATTLAACGGSNDSAAERAAQSRAYASAVSQVTTRTSVRLAEISGQADYRDAAAAAQSTRDYAASIRAAADDLARTEPPAGVATQHRALTTLYRTTADHMDTLAAGFATLTGKRAIAQQAQRLSAEVQRYSTQETQLRSEIERLLSGDRGDRR